MIEALIAEAKQVYELAGLDCGHGLLPPASEDKIASIATRLSLPVPEELRAVYQVHGGQNYIDPGVTGLFGEHRLHTPDELVEHQQMHVENYLTAFDPPPVYPPAAGQSAEWVPELLPFASWDAYELCIHAHTGEVWEFLPIEGLTRRRDNIAAVLSEVIVAVRAGGEAQMTS